MRWVLLAALVMVAAAATNSSCDLTTACALCKADLRCLFLYPNCAGLADALAYYSAPQDPRRLYYPAAWASALPSLSAACASVSTSSLNTNSLLLLDALISYKVFLTTAGLGCTDVNERVVCNPDHTICSCTCAVGHICDAADSGVNVADVGYGLLIATTSTSAVLVVVGGIALTVAVLRASQKTVV